MGMNMLEMAGSALLKVCSNRRVCFSRGGVLAGLAFGAIPGLSGTDRVSGVHVFGEPVGR